MAGLFVTDMTPEQVANARKWIDALRSGKYKQGRRGLRPTPNTFDCLGVGFDVASAGRDLTGSAEEYGVVSEYESLQKLVGLVDPEGRRGTGPSLTHLNDQERRTCARIADVIEAELALVVEVTA